MGEEAWEEMLLLASECQLDAFEGARREEKKSFKQSVILSTLWILTRCLCPSSATGRFYWSVPAVMEIAWSDFVEVRMGSSKQSTALVSLLGIHLHYSSDPSPDFQNTPDFWRTLLPSYLIWVYGTGHPSASLSHPYVTSEQWPFSAKYERTWKIIHFLQNGYLKRGGKTQASAPAEGKNSRTYQWSRLRRNSWLASTCLAPEQSQHVVFRSLRALSFLWERRAAIIVLMLYRACKLQSGICRKRGFVSISFMSQLFCFRYSPALLFAGKSRHILDIFTFLSSVGLHLLHAFLCVDWLCRFTLTLKPQCRSHHNWAIVLGSA